MTGDETGRDDERDRRSTLRITDGTRPPVRAFLDVFPAGRALDIATGQGRNALVLAEAGWNVDAIDISTIKLSRARERASEWSDSIAWILADVDSYAFPETAYDVITVSFFDARDRLAAIKSALKPGGVLFYEHYLESESGASGPGDRYRFEPGELLTACTDLTILFYLERRIDGEPHVVLVARNGADGESIA
ncbi:class I SAM-dependent methyltransferase [Halopiger djelfimassiliensis]|uniref:class I SAM-dependent methyltransferase n=1 Tax=Halopiger djelfimassiliensis TaxID=1293047 RepID=UPI00067832CF|nr:class I SAM-dependent methyltransferase [Halopiger djelfimassiliensis]